MYRFFRFLELLAAVMLSWCTSTVLFAADGSEPLEWPQYDEIEEVWAGSFATAPVCAECHGNSDQSVAMRDSQGRPIGAYDLWRSSMMANSFRDPYWHAAVSAEVLDLPELSEAIEAKCLRCHGPMASVLAEFDERPPATRHSVELEFNDAQLAEDGVSCTLCHQISDKGLGQPESYSGGFDVIGNFQVYGPYYDAYGQNMQLRSDYAPTYGEHISQSAMCATCHTLFTHPVDPNGEVLETAFPEQTPYLEWRNSVFSTEGETPGPQAADCQDCHMPRTGVDGDNIFTAIAHDHDGRDYLFLPGRSPYDRHLFVGGNTFMPQIFINHQSTLRPDVPVSAFEETLARTREQLNRDAGRVELLDVTQIGGTLKATVSVRNLTGHKFPTGYPSRRAWLYFEARDTTGELLFVSGAYNEEGRLTDGNGDVLGTERIGQASQPHYQVINSDDQVQIYQAVMRDAAGAQTNRLMRAVAYLKDNRLLPLGYDNSFPDATHTAPQGLNNDPDFVGGGDRVHYEIPLTESTSVASVTVRLYFQSIGSRHLEELFELEANDIRVFKAMMEAVDKRPELVAESSFVFGEGSG